MIVFWSLPCALQNRRASLHAVSTASEPPDPKNTAPSTNGENSTIRSASSIAGSFAWSKKQWYEASFDICAAAASAISVRPWPTETNHRPADASRYSRPAESQTRAPSPRVTTNSLPSTAPIAAKPCQRRVMPRKVQLPAHGREAASGALRERLRPSLPLRLRVGRHRRRRGAARELLLPAAEQDPAAGDHHDHGRHDQGVDDLGAAGQTADLGVQR